jgi:hypothetical protein
MYYSHLYIRTHVVAVSRIPTWHNAIPAPSLSSSELDINSQRQVSCCICVYAYRHVYTQYQLVIVSLLRQAELMHVMYQIFYECRLSTVMNAVCPRSAICEISIPSRLHTHP